VSPKRRRLDALRSATSTVDKPGIGATVRELRKDLRASREVLAVNAVLSPARSPVSSSADPTSRNDQTAL
jgi:hypothetical protein